MTETIYTKAIVFQSDGYYVCQGLEVDYMATSNSLDDITYVFVSGLSKTIMANLDRGNDVQKTLPKSKTPDCYFKAFQEASETDQLKHILKLRTGINPVSNGFPIIIDFYSIGDIVPEDEPDPAAS